MNSAGCLDERKQSPVGSIPSDWDVTTLGDEFDVSAGGDWDAANSEQLRDNDHPYPVYANALAPNAVQGYCSYFTIPGESLTVTGRGDVGKAVYRPHPFVPVVRLLALVPRSDSSAKFFAEYINCCVRFSLESTGVPQLTVPQVRPYLVARPSGAEQRAIASVLEDADELIELLDHLIAKNRAIKQGLMQQLLTGRTRLHGFSGEWNLIRLGQVAQFSRGSGLPKSDISVHGAVACIHYGELFTYYGAEIQTVTSRTDRVDLRVRSMAMDVLMPTSDVTPRGLAKASAVFQSGVVLGGDTLVIRADSREIYGPFLANVIRHDADQVLALVRGSTVFHVYAADMRNFQMLVPGVAEQQAICSLIRDAQARIDALVGRRMKAQAIKKGLVQELLTGRTRLAGQERAS